MDTRLQNKALAAAEEAIAALGRGDVALARMAVAAAVDIDQVGAFGRLADSVYLIASQLEDGEVEPGAWDQLADAVDEPRLLAMVEAARG